MPASPGNVIWSTDLIVTQHNSTAGGKGGATATVSQTSYTYSVHCAVGICAGPIAGINAIWADSTIIYQDGVWTSGMFDSVTIYTGAAGQTPDSFMQSILGTANVPAYQGLAYIVFDNLQLSNFGSRLPNLTFEIAAAAGTNNPEWLGSVDAALSQRPQSIESGLMLPITLQGSASNAQTVLVGGYKISGSTATFTVAAYDVTASAPVPIQSVNSAAFTSSNPPSDCSCAGPGWTFCCPLFAKLHCPYANSFVLFDTDTMSFGALYSASFAASSVNKQIVWLDLQHFMIRRCVRQHARLACLRARRNRHYRLGFTPMWGSGSLTSTAPFYGAQFTPYADGLIAYNWITTVVNTLTLQARTVAWRNNQLALGTIYTVASGLPLGAGSGPHARFLQTASGEWTLFFATVLYYRIMSFEPSATSAVITRSWKILISALSPAQQISLFFTATVSLLFRPPRLDTLT